MTQLDLTNVKNDFSAAMEEALSFQNAKSESIKRSMRGVAFVIMFGAYERLLRSTSRELIETASTYKKRAIDYSPGFATVCVSGKLDSLNGKKKAEIWNHSALEVVTSLRQTVNRMNASFFPDDGSYMDQSQIRTFSNFFGLKDPASILQNTWERIPEVRRNRNKIAHGEELPSFIGGSYTDNDLEEIGICWQKGWIRFLENVEIEGSSETFWLNTPE